MTFQLTAKQQRAQDILKGDARHILLYGGSRSGKTFLLMRAIIIRALAHKSRHAVLRFRFNHVKSSIIFDTLPNVMEKCFPEVGQHCHLDKSDWFYSFPNGSEIWFGGLDDKERTEKILGQEYASLLLNECSQIPWASRVMAVTRLAQKTPLRLKAYYDCNPPSKGHWTYKLFMEKRSPDTRMAVANPNDYGWYGPLNAKDNVANIAPEYLAELDALPERQRQRFRDGQFGTEADNALWTIELLEQCRFDGGELPVMQRIVVAVDPSGSSGPEDTRSDEVGIVVCGLGVDGKGYVLEDLSGRFGPAQWGKLAVSAFDRYQADSIVAETNYGGAMVEEIIRAASSGSPRSVPFRQVTASRGKVVRAEPIATLFEQQKVVMACSSPQLDDQLCAMTTGGYIGDRSPDRADAMIWGLAFLFPGMTRKEEQEFRPRPQVILGYQGMKRRRA
jgi:predicted phage terminase large subunit-like protein